MREGSHFVKSVKYMLVVTCTGGRDWQGKGHVEDSVAELWLCCNTSQLLTNQNLKTQVFWHVNAVLFGIQIPILQSAEPLCSGSRNPILLDCMTADTPSIMSVTIYQSIRCNTAVTDLELENVNLTIGQWNCWQRVECADGSFSLEPWVGTEWVNYNIRMKASKSVFCWLRAAAYKLHPSVWYFGTELIQKYGYY